MPESTTTPASMGEPLSEAELTHYGDLIDTVPGPGPALSWTAEARLLAEAQRARARVGVLEGQLATAQAEVVIRDGAIVGRDKAIDSLEAWRRNWNPLVDAHMKRCSGCDACDSEDGDDA